MKMQKQRISSVGVLTNYKLDRNISKMNSIIEALS
jgi:hypothetical protein